MNETGTKGNNGAKSVPINSHLTQAARDALERARVAAETGAMYVPTDDKKYIDKTDYELEALNACVRALGYLKPHEQARVIRYLVGRYATDL